jgi:6-phosphogluconolactonase
MAPGNPAIKMEPHPSSSAFWVGTYTTPAPHVPAACGEGILRGKLDSLTGEITLTVAAAGAPDPSYLATGHGRLFAVAERPGAEGGLHVHQVMADGSLTLEEVHSSGGSHPCHLAVVGGEVAVANYIGDRLQVFSRRTGNTGWQRRGAAPYSGSGPLTSRQEAPHPHHVSFLKSHGQLAVCDLGCDRIWLHRVTASGIEPEVAGFIALPAGTGPRHLVQGPDPRHIYVLGEFHGNILHYHHNEGSWNFIADWPHSETSGPGTAGAAIKLHPSGNTLYASARSSGLISIFRIAGTTGALEPVGTIPSGGKCPRDIAIDPSGRWLIALNQDSNSISCIPIHPTSGMPTGEPGTSTHCGTPVCMVF